MEHVRSKWEYLMRLRLTDEDYRIILVRMFEGKVEGPLSKEMNYQDCQVLQGVAMPTETGTHRSRRLIP